MSTHGEGSGKVRGTQTDEDKNDNMDSESKKRHNKINSLKYVKNDREGGRGKKEGRGKQEERRKRGIRREEGGKQEGKSS